MHPLMLYTYEIIQSQLHLQVHVQHNYIQRKCKVFGNFFLIDTCILQCIYVHVHAGAIAESRGWVRPVQANQPLKEALLAYIKPPNSHQKLRTLSEYVSYC